MYNKKVVKVWMRATIFILFTIIKATKSLSAIYFKQMWDLDSKTVLTGLLKR